MELYKEETIHAILIGLVVDYLTRVAIGTSVEKAFKISLQGARNVNEIELANELLNAVMGLDD